MLLIKNILYIILSLVIFSSCSSQSVFIDSEANNASHNSYEHYERILQNDDRVYSTLGKIGYMIDGKIITEDKFLKSKIQTIEVKKDAEMIKKMGFDETIDAIVIGIK